MQLIHDNLKILDRIILYSLFPLLLMDMLNGILYENDLELVISVSQVYKLLVIFLFCLRLGYSHKVLFKILAYGVLLFVPTLIQVFFNNAGYDVLFLDVIRTSKYLIIIISFYYFKEQFISRDKVFDLFFKWIKFSFWVLAVNLMSKLVGMGYPMYEVGNIGTRGYFIAGNEISALLIVLSSIIGYYYLEIKRNKYLFLFYAVLSFSLGLLISSKTGMLGIVLVYGFMLLGTYDYSQKITRKLVIRLISTISFIGFVLVFFVLNTSILGRYSVFWNKLDFITFVLSSRNLYFQEAVLIVNENYQFIDYVLGIGPTLYYELASKFVEIDFIDVFFSYGILGLLVLTHFYVDIFKDIIKLLKLGAYPFAKLTIITFIFLMLLSFLSGHILNSGIAGVFIGFTFAIMYNKCEK